MRVERGARYGHLASEGRAKGTVVAELPPVASVGHRAPRTARAATPHPQEGAVRGASSNARSDRHI